MSQTKLVGAVLVALAAMLESCATPQTNEAVLLPDTGADSRIQEACAVTARVCTRCHKLNRIYVTQLDAPVRWRQLVARMRYMSSSNITDAEAAEATTCLVYRAFGQQGLVDLATKENRP